MGMYTEFILLGEATADIPDDVRVLFRYFFGSDYIPTGFKPPDHPFFRHPRWLSIGNMSSHYFTPFAIRHNEQHIREPNALHVFLRCDLKNYHDEIQLFIDWIKPYMRNYRGWIWYEENPEPEIIKYGRWTDE